MKKDVKVLKVKKMHPTASLPSYAHIGDAGFDLKANLPTAVTIYPGERKLIGTGVALDIPYGYEVQIRPRSGLALKHGISVLNTPGTIDYGYKQEIGVILINLGDHPYTVRPDERIAQGVLAPVTFAIFEEVDDFDEGFDRGGGFGSTGK
jgi:dUTP pyrophosphatase